MKHTFSKIAAVTVIASLSFAACKKVKEDHVPHAHEQELITSVKIRLTNADGFDKTFTYKVENGFGSNTPGTISIDTLVLAPNKSYNAEVTVIGKHDDHEDDITSEVISESDEHLFVFESNPPSGAGALLMTEGNKDGSGNPFNQKVKLTTDATGNGTLTLTLKHEPANKAASTASAAGGSTDAEAVYPVRIQ